MAKTHYETLGVAPNATSEQIRSAYRKLVLKHHPDRSKDPASKPIFLAVTDAYHVLIDPDQRRRYDEKLAPRPTSTPKTGSAPPPREPAAPKQAATQKPSEPSIAEEVGRMMRMFQTGQLDEAEKKARAVLRRDSRQAVPYAVLGDIARGRGKLSEAQKMYAYAVQMEPSNPIFQRRYEELLAKSQVISDSRRTRLEPEDKKIIAPMVGGIMVLAAGMYLGLTRETPFLAFLPLIGSYSLSTYVMLFLSGVVVGCSLSLGNLLDRFTATSMTSTGRMSPNLSLGCIAMVQFWAAVVLYGLIGLVRRGWNVSTTRLIGGVSVATAVLSVGAALSMTISPPAVFIWGGNLVYLGALVGWMTADSFR